MTQSFCSVRLKHTEDRVAEFCNVLFSTVWLNTCHQRTLDPSTYQIIPYHSNIEGWYIQAAYAYLTHPIIWSLTQVIRNNFSIHCLTSISGSLPSFYILFLIPFLDQLPRKSISLLSRASREKSSNNKRIGQQTSFFHVSKHGY